MKKYLFLFILILVGYSLSFSQMNYTFTSGTDTYTDIGGTNAFNNGSNNSISGNIALGFTFEIGCDSYTQMQICTEGWIGLGGGMTTNSVNNLSGTTQRPIIAPLWDNIRVSSSNGGRIRYQLSGTAPNRVMTVQYRRMRWNETNGANNSRHISFIVKFYETTNVIDFVYRQENNNSNNESASVGIAGPLAGDFISISNAGVASTVTEANVTQRPSTNTRYRFTPGAVAGGCSGTPSSGTTSTSVPTVTCGSPNVNFSVTGSSTGCGIAYQWQSSPDGTTWTDIPGAIAETLSQSVLATTFYRRVTTCTNSSLSANSSSVQVTFTGCTGVPAGGTLTPSTNSTNCNSSTVNFTVTGSASGCGVTYQWQYSTDGTTFTDLAGETSVTMTADILATGYYRREITCAANGISNTSNAVLITNSDTSPINDLPCYSILLSAGVSSTGNNDCSSNEFEPAGGSCWTGGTDNTVWYSIVAPASGSVRIQTIITASANVLQRTQIALYSGTCSSLTEIACNEDAPDCGSYGPENSEIIATGLTPGATYFVSVDGENSDVGDFGILYIDGTGSFPNVQGQDCPTAFTVCNPTTTIGNPGYQAIGGQCDHDGSGNCTSGEANSVWYTININPLLVGTAALEFDIVPNDFGNPNPITGIANPGYTGPGDETDYDFVLYKISGSGSTTCAGILAGDVSVACNFSFLGTTGCTASGNAPAAYAGFDGSYDVSPLASAGDTYVLVIQNFSNSTAGFTLDFPLISPAVYTPPTTVFWTGGAFDSNWDDFDNWGGCISPACGRSAVITASSVNQPILTGGNYDVDNITINPGASLTIQNGATLRVCGDFTNNGSLICMPGSTVLFRQGATQNVTGAFENADSFFDLTVGKNGGSVIFNSNVDVDGDFTTNNNNSIVNSNGVHVQVGGDFDNANGNSTYTNTGTTGTLEFSGTTAATYDEGNSQLDLNFVVMDKTGADLTLNSDMFIKATTGTLTLTNGKIITGGDRVDVANGAPAAVNAGNVNSYIVGDLYRTLNGSPGSFEFPLGTLANYERANVTFTSATTIPRLLTRFDPWGGAPNTIGLTECLGNYILPAQDMGIWTLNASANPTSGTYDMTLYSTGAANTAGASGWTIQKAASEAGPWTFNGTCAFSTVSVIARTGMNGFSVFGVAQSTTPLPIELMDFSGYRYNDVNVLKWTTASELNSDYFNVEKSRNGKDFQILEQINAQGNSFTPFNYTSVDESPFNGITYYRLSFYDLDGTNEYSKTIAVSSDTPKDLKIGSIFPNPGKDELNIDYSVSTKSELQLSFADASGRVLKTERISVKGIGTYTVSTADLADGVYMFSVTDINGFKEVHSWVKK